jgi:membrane protein DedA with SNARE-associated domain
VTAASAAEERGGGQVPVFAISVIFAALHGALKYLTNAFARHGYAILFGLVTAESFWLPLPGELSLLAGGYEASRGKLNVFWVAGAGMAAAITGDNLAYLFGRLAGRPLIERLARVLHLHAKRVETMDHYFDRHAGMTIVTARWISPLRGLAALSAGAAHVSWRRFAVFNAIGSITWAASVTALAYGLSRSLGELADIFDVTGLVVVGLLLVGVGVVVFFWWRRRKARLLRARRHDATSADAQSPLDLETAASESGAPTHHSEPHRLETDRPDMGDGYTRASVSCVPAGKEPAPAREERAPACEE